MRVRIHSVLEQIAQDVFQMKDVNKAKEFIINFLNEKEINDEDKNHIIETLQTKRSMYAVQSYICNSLLQYEGLSTKLYNKKE